MGELPAPQPGATRLPSRLRRLWPVVLGVVAALITLLAYRVLFPPAPPLTPQAINQVVATAIAAATPRPAYSSTVYQAIQPSLVLIETTDTVTTTTSNQGLGSGVVVSERGDILTSLHVVAGARSITLTFADGSTSPADVVAQQPEHDIAVLRAQRPPRQLVPATLGNPKALRVGDEAYIVGNPLGLYGSMSAGVVSGLDRAFKPRNSAQRLEGLIQTDAAANPGNSGGPLLNREGQVVGIVVGLVNPTDQDVFIGLSFAVPIDVAGGAAGLVPY